ncbi:MAG: TolC family protein [Methylococcales bacterium]|nr:TolC family protein [Methylococcales bacterium]
MHSRFSLTIITLLPLLISSCASFEDHPLNTVESVARIEARSLSNPQLRQFIYSAVGDKKSWDIDTLTLAAIYYHSDVALAQALAESADAAITTAGQRPNPSFTLSPTWISNLATAAAPWIIASSLSVPIETAGKRDFRIAKAEHLTEAARLRVADAVWVVRGRLRLALLEFYAAREVERLSQQQLAIEQIINQRLKQQLAIGEISRVELTRSRLALNQLQLNVETAQKRLAESRVLLATAIGVPVDALAGVELDVSQFSYRPDLNALPIAKLRATALHERPDLLAILADYAATQSALQLEIANQYPNIQANPSYTWEMGENRWSLGGTAVQLPILHQNQGLIGEAEAKRREIAVRFEALQLRIMGEIDKARAGIAAVVAKLETAEQQRRNEQDHLHAVQELLKAGEADALALLTAELESAVVERARLDVLVESQQALSLLEDTLRYPIASTLTAVTINKAAIRKTP